jgi:EAL and modified HD-GYP domain-containing signal transduction protein
MKDWFKRILGKSRVQHAASVATPVPPRHAHQNPPMPSIPGVRRPLVAANGEVAGFEFALAASLEQRLSRREDPVAHAAHAISLMSAMRPALDSGRIALASLPMSLLLRHNVIDQVPTGAWLCLEAAEDAGADAQTALADLRGCGVRVGTRQPELTGSTGARGSGFDFTLLRLDDFGIDALIASVRQRRAADASATLVVTGLADVDAIESVLCAGATLASGDFNAKVCAPKQRALQGDVQRIIVLLNAVRDERKPLTELTRELRGDVGLCYRLLRHVNSPAVAVSRPVESIDQAVLILGRSELYRWLSVLLLASVSGRPTSGALQEVSLARARLLELLARECGSEPPDALFTVGLLSLLNVMLEVPMSQALQPLRLSEAAHLALLDRSGPWHQLLILSEALERHDLDAVAAAATGFGGVERVSQLSDEAWRWALSVQRNG